MGLMETSSARAWSEFRTRLADHVTGFDLGETLRLDVPPGSVAITLGLTDDGRISAATVGACPSEADAGTLLTLGWEDATITVERREADRLAVLVVRTLREVFDVLHPSFLGCDVAHLLDLVDDPEPVADEPAVQFPADRDAVVRMVDAAIAGFLGHEPFKDDDLDIPIVCGESVVYVRVMRDATVLVQSDLVREAPDSDAVRFEVNVLNRDHPDVQFSYVGGTVRVQRRLASSPFVAQHVREAAADMCRLVEDVADDLVHRVGGRLFLDDTDTGIDAGPGADAVELSPEMATVIELEAGRPGSLDATLVAGIFRMDRDLLLAEIDATDKPWQVDLLRAALRLVVEAEVARLRDAGRRLPQQRPRTDDGVVQRPVLD